MRGRRHNPLVASCWISGQHFPSTQNLQCWLLMKFYQKKCIQIKQKNICNLCKSPASQFQPLIIYSNSGVANQDQSLQKLRVKCEVFFSPVAVFFCLFAQRKHDKIPQTVFAAPHFSQWNLLWWINSLSELVKCMKTTTKQWSSMLPPWLHSTLFHAQVLHPSPPTFHSAGGWQCCVREARRRHGGLFCFWESASLVQ